MSVTKRRTDGQFLIFLGSLAFILIGAILLNQSRGSVYDFRMIYSGTRCVLEGCNPYNQADVLRTYHATGAERASESDRDRLVATRIVYPPTTFAFTAPFALFSFGSSQFLWTLAIAGSLILAAFLMWNLAAGLASTVSAMLLSFCLFNSGSVILFGNPGCLAVSLTVVAAWCILENRFVFIGILCLAAGLALKPQDAGSIWVCFILAGGTFRRRALQALVIAAASSLPMLLWVTHLSPQWPHELHANMVDFFARGSTNDPSGGHGTCNLTNVQTITSFFWDNPRTYNLVGYLICAPLLLTWVIVSWRSRPSRERMWFGLAAVSALSMLPVYHRQYDAKLIILAIPALALLWSRRGRVAWVGLVVTATAFVLNGDLPWVIFLTTVNMFHLHAGGPWGRLLTALSDFPVPLSLLIMGGFYLWIYMRHTLDVPREQLINGIQEFQIERTSA